MWYPRFHKKVVLHGFLKVLLAVNIQEVLLFMFITVFVA